MVSIYTDASVCRGLGDNFFEISGGQHQTAVEKDLTNE
jgi:hypothetical protein